MTIMGERLRCNIITVLVTALSFTGLYFAKLYNYLLFHTIAELFSVIIAVTIFIIYLNTYEHFDTGFYGIIGPVYLITAILDFLHTLSYSGMNIFIGNDADLPTSLWIASRYIESFGLLAGILLIRSRPKKMYIFALSIVIGGAAVTAIFSGVFPRCYVDGEGLTTFKKMSEYIICAVLLVTIYLCYQRRFIMEGREVTLLISAVFVTIGAELSFTLYSDPYGYFNMFGHYLKIVSYYLIYRAIIITGLHYPYSELREKEKVLTSILVEKNILLKELHHRVKNNLQNIISLLQLQTSRTQDPDVTEHLNVVVRRVKSIGIIHEMMYHNQDLGKISYKEYFRNFIKELFKLFPEKKKGVDISIDGDDLLLSLDVAVPVGLFTNEIVTTRLNYAFPEGRHGKIEVKVRDRAEDGTEIRIIDNGISALSDTHTIEEVVLGMNLTKSLVRQVAGSIETKLLQSGHTVHIISMSRL